MLSRPPYPLYIVQTLYIDQGGAYRQTPYIYSKVATAAILWRIPFSIFCIKTDFELHFSSSIAVYKITVFFTEVRFLKKTFLSMAVLSFCIPYCRQVIQPFYTLVLNFCIPYCTLVIRISTIFLKDVLPTLLIPNLVYHTGDSYIAFLYPDTYLLYTILQTSNSDKYDLKKNIFFAGTISLLLLIFCIPYCRLVCRIRTIS